MAVMIHSLTRRLLTIEIPNDTSSNRGRFWIGRNQGKGYWRLPILSISNDEKVKDFGINLKQTKMVNSMGVSCLIKVIEEAKAWQKRALASSILRQLNRRA